MENGHDETAEEYLPEVYPPVMGVNFASDVEPSIVACPDCTGDSWAHPSAVRVWPLDDQGTGYEVSDHGLLRFRQMPIRVRGVVIVIEYRCEAGHHFEERRQFHKGQTFAEVTPTACNCHDITTLWRD